MTEVPLENTPAEYLNASLDRATAKAATDAALVVHAAVTVACDANAALTPAQVPQGVMLVDEYIRGARDAAEAIRASMATPVAAFVTGPAS